MKNMTKKVLNSARSYLYNTEHKREAMNAVSVITKYNAQSLSPKLKKIADDYSLNVFGSASIAAVRTDEKSAKRDRSVD